MGWKHSASTMTPLWKRITHSPARLTLRFAGVNCMAESNEYGSAIAKTHPRAHTSTAQTLGRKIYEQFETRTDARRGNRILRFACIRSQFFRDVYRKFHDQNKRFILTFMRRVTTRWKCANGAWNGVYRLRCSIYNPGIFGKKLTQDSTWVV